MKPVSGLGLPLIAIGAALIAPSPAFAGVLSQTATIPLAKTDWSATAEVGQLNPSLGALRSIGFGLTGTLRGTISVESLDPAASTAAGAIASTISLSIPGGQGLSVNPNVGASASLAAFDGRVDFAGASGRTFSGLSNTQSAQTTYTVGASGPQIPTAPFIGAGKVALPVTATASAGISGPLDLAARTQAAAGAAVTVKYVTGSPPAGNPTYAGASDFTLGTGWALASFADVRHTAVQVRALSDRNGDWTRGVAFDPFDPALGTLISADITLQGDVKSKLSVQNTGPGAAGYSVEQSALFDLLRPDGTSLGSSEAASTRSGILAPFRGTDDFTKPFGISTSDSFLGPLDAFSTDDGPDLALFSEPGPLALAVQAMTNLGGSLPGNADLLSSGVEGARVTLSYTYAPGADPAPDPPPAFASAAAAVPEPGSLALLLASLSGFGLARARRQKKR